jgi:mannose-6-phosphate isomerase-like protein (cupin superfamily)
MGSRLREELEAHTGRYALKTPDWDAFPANRGFPELARAQIRYIGAGGSPKHDDPSALPAEHFTLSLIFQEPGRYAATHQHEIEEAFLVLQGVLTVSWDFDGQLVDVRLGPKDLILNPPGRPHGFRNEGLEPVLMSIMVGSARPLAPVYTDHPKDAPAPKPAGKASQTNSSDHRSQIERYVVRYRQARPEWLPAGFARVPYLGPGGVAAIHYRDDLIHLPRDRRVQPYARNVEEAYFVLQGCLTVGWQHDGETVETRLGPKDLVLNPPGCRHYFRNDGLEDAQFEMVVGSSQAETVNFLAA